MRWKRRMEEFMQNQAELSAIECQKCHGVGVDRWPVDDPLLYCHGCRATWRQDGEFLVRDEAPTPDDGGFYIPIGIQKALEETLKEPTV